MQSVFAPQTCWDFGWWPILGLFFHLCLTCWSVCFQVSVRFSAKHTEYPSVPWLTDLWYTWSVSWHHRNCICHGESFGWMACFWRVHCALNKHSSTLKSLKFSHGLKCRSLCRVPDTELKTQVFRSELVFIQVAQACSCQEKTPLIDPLVLSRAKGRARALSFL